MVGLNRRRAATGSTADRAARALGVPHATALVIVDLLPGSRAYCETFADALPILVIDCGYTELHLGIPGCRAGLDDLAIIGGIMDAVADCRTALVAYLD